jgi:hypothetical protein
VVVERRDRHGPVNVVRSKVVETLIDLGHTPPLSRTILNEPDVEILDIVVPLERRVEEVALSRPYDRFLRGNVDQI